LTGQANQLLGILLVGSSRRPYVELRQHIRSAALLAGGAGMILAILLSGWAAARVTRPVEQLARAAREVADGNWNTQVTVQSTDELGELAASFNRMDSRVIGTKRALSADRTSGRVARVGAAFGSRAEESALPSPIDGRKFAAGTAAKS